MNTLGILGAGRVGTALARTAVAAGEHVLIAGSGDVTAIDLIVSITAPGAIPVNAHQAISGSDVVVLALPLHRYRTLDPDAFAGKTVIDAMNYWEPIDGYLAEFDQAPSSSVIAGHLPGARLVKTLNHVGYHDLDVDARPAGAPDRRAMAIAGDDVDAVETVAALIDRLGYDPVIRHRLDAGVAFEPGTEIFASAHNRIGVDQLLTATLAGRTLRAAPAPTTSIRPDLTQTHL